MKWEPPSPQYTKTDIGGVFSRGGIYYSSEKPQGTKDTLQFDVPILEIFKRARLGNSRQATKKAQETLVHIGYIEPQYADADLNRQTLGAMKRWEYNFSREIAKHEGFLDDFTPEKVWGFIKDKLWFSDKDINSK